MVNRITIRDVKVSKLDLLERSHGYTFGHLQSWVDVETANSAVREPIQITNTRINGE